MRSTRVKNVGYLLIFLPQLLFVVGVVIGLPWLAVIFFFALLPVLRFFVGNDESPPNVNPSPRQLAYLRGLPRLYFATWAIVLPWTLWVLATDNLTALEYAGLGVSFWIVCSLNTAIAHELIHSGSRIDQTLGVILDASVGYFHFTEEHYSHHARSGHFVGGDAAKPGESVYRFAVARYARSFVDAWEYETSRMKRLGLSWPSNRLLRKALIPLSIASVFFHFGGWPALVFYGLEILGAAFAIQAITYLQHWGLSQKRTPELEDYGFAWEDGCWMQACVTLNHAYHGQHHLSLRLPYYRLSMLKGALTLPASYPVMFVLALFPPAYTKIMQARLQAWRASLAACEAQAYDGDCIGAARIARLLRQI